MIGGAMFAAPVGGCCRSPAEEVAVTVDTFDLGDVLLLSIWQRAAWQRRRPRATLTSPKLQLGDDHSSSPHDLRLSLDPMHTDCAPGNAMAISKKQLSPIFFNYTLERGNISAYLIVLMADIYPIDV
jgi:hypothetical protein